MVRWCLFWGRIDLASKILLCWLILLLKIRETHLWKQCQLCLSVLNTRGVLRVPLSFLCLQAKHVGTWAARTFLSNSVHEVSWVPEQFPNLQMDGQTPQKSLSWCCWCCCSYHACLLIQNNEGTNTFKRIHAYTVRSLVRRTLLLRLRTEPIQLHAMIKVPEYLLMKKLGCKQWETPHFLVRSFILWKWNRQTHKCRSIL